uniref:Nicotinate phosphoribosyltransferase n=1 Tax=Aureoumbra lagunensis TaxID=44058 RepID=A0A7S3K7T5_9STRA|mmetsp:Transcript_18271/g.27545  ORF Transcript_18271/g.27545 Transcript_18271/m.27545 type:complete len:564 (-) Transcript_18271:231-1922(-)
MTEFAASQDGPRNPLVNPLLTDFYQLSMAYAYWRQNRHEERACFEVFFRSNPFGGEFTVFAGLEEVLRFIDSFEFKEDEIDFVRSILPNAEDAFFAWLERLNCKKIKMFAIKEGTVVFPYEPLLRIEGPLAIAQMIETTVLNLINYPSLVCTNAARYRLAVGSEKKLFEFGARRAQGPDGALSASRYAYMGGFDGTSHVLAAKLFSIPVSGTQAHAFVQSFTSLDDLPNDSLCVGHVDSLKLTALQWRKELGYNENDPKFYHIHDGEFAAFIAYAYAFPTKFIALVDTYSTLDSGLKNFVCVLLALAQAGFIAVGCRIDSGDLAYLSLCAQDLFQQLANRIESKQIQASWLTNTQRSDAIHALRTQKIIASNDINESVLLSLRDQNHAIDAFGVGTHLVTCHNQPALGCVYKLVEINNKPTIKVSNDLSKTTIPCAKQPYRLISAHGLMLLDLLVPTNHAAPEIGERILCRHPFDHQKKAYVTPAKVIPLHKLVYDGGATEAVQSRPSLDDIKNYVEKQLRLVRYDILRSLNPTPYKVSVSPQLFSFFVGLLESNEPIRELVA